MSKNTRLCADELVQVPRWEYAQLIKANTILQVIAKVWRNDADKESYQRIAGNFLDLMYGGDDDAD